MLRYKINAESSQTSSTASRFRISVNIKQYHLKKFSQSEFRSFPYSSVEIKTTLMKAVDESSAQFTLADPDLGNCNII